MLLLKFTCSSIAPKVLYSPKSFVILNIFVKKQFLSNRSFRTSIFVNILLGGLSCCFKLFKPNPIYKCLFNPSMEKSHYLINNLQLIIYRNWWQDKPFDDKLSVISLVCSNKAEALQAMLPGTILIVPKTRNIWDLLGFN